MDDFDYLHRALFDPNGSFFDGYGSVLYWRPLGRQIYFGLLTPLLLAYPVVVPLVHGVCLALVALVLYRAFRVRWSGGVAAAMASFILLMESTRMLLAWPSHFMDLGAILFAALALHEAAHRRWVTALLAMLGSLLGKEIGVTTALLLPWMPPAGAPGRDWRGRIAPSVAMAAMLAVWGTAYMLSCRIHGMTLPHRFEPLTLATPWLTRYAWSCWHSARAMFSLSPAGDRWDGVVLIGAAVLLLIAVARLATDRTARARLAPALPWVAWGLAWFLAASAALTEVYPAWAPYRAVFAGVGFGVAVTALLAAAHPALVAGLVGLRLLAFSVSPGPPATITAAQEITGAVYDFSQLVRLERLVRETRGVLTTRFARLPRGAVVVRHAMPTTTYFAFSGDRALQVWYRDSTLRWLSFDEFRRDPHRRVAAIVEWQPPGGPQMATVAPDAMRALLEGMEHLARSEWVFALAALDRAESLQDDPTARLFLGTVLSKRALCLFAVEQPEAADRAARAALALWPENPDSHFALARLRLDDGAPEQAEAHLDSLLSLYPDDRGARDLLEEIRARRPGGAP